MGGVWGGVWGVCAINTERVCRLVLPGVRTCSPFGEGVIHVWMGGLGAHTWGRV